MLLQHAYAPNSATHVTICRGGNVAPTYAPPISALTCDIFWMDSGILQFRILYILPVQILTRALTECEPAVGLLVVLL